MSAVPSSPHDSSHDTHGATDGHASPAPPHTSAGSPADAAPSSTPPAADATPPPAAAAGGSPPPPNTPDSPRAIAAPDKLYCFHPLSADDPQEIEICAGTIGVVVPDGKTSVYPGVYTVHQLLGKNRSGVLYAVRSGTTVVHVSLTVESRDRVKIKAELRCSVRLDPTRVVGERNPEEALTSFVCSAALRVFSEYTAYELSNAGADGVDMGTVQRRIEEICSKEEKEEKGVAGVTIQRIDFKEPWQILDPEKIVPPKPAPIAGPPDGGPPPAPPDPPAEQLLKLLQEEGLRKDVVAACLSALIDWGLVAAERQRFTNIQKAATELPPKARQSLIDLIKDGLTELGERRQDE